MKATAPRSITAAATAADGDKAKACQLTTAFCDGIPYYEEAGARPPLCKSCTIRT